MGIKHATTSWPVSLVNLTSCGVFCHCFHKLLSEISLVGYNRSCFGGLAHAIKLSGHQHRIHPLLFSTSNRTPHACDRVNRACLDCADGDSTGRFYFLGDRAAGVVTTLIFNDSQHIDAINSHFKPADE